MEKRERIGRSQGSAVNPRLLATIPLITGGLLDNTRVGSAWFRLNVPIALANTNTTIAHGLGRKPSVYRQCGTRTAGGVLYDDGTQVGWTVSAIVLKASIAGSYDLEIM